MDAQIKREAKEKSELEAAVLGLVENTPALEQKPRVRRMLRALELAGYAQITVTGEPAYAWHLTEDGKRKKAEIVGRLFASVPR